jgi:hypothetical protein
LENESTVQMHIGMLLYERIDISINWSEISTNQYKNIRSFDKQNTNRSIGSKTFVASTKIVNGRIQLTWV